MKRKTILYLGIIYAAFPSFCIVRLTH